MMNQLKRIRIWVLLVLLAAILGVVILITENRPTRVGSGISLNTLQNIDTVNNMGIDAAVDITESESVSQSPQFLLGQTSASLFTNAVLQAIATELGFTENAEVDGINTVYIWVEGAKNLSVDIQTGTISFSTAFNLENVQLPGSPPTEQMARTALETFLQQTQLPTDYLDIENIEFEYMLVDDRGRVTPVLSGTGPLLKANIAYQVVDRELVLPIESYIIVDGDGVIRLMSFYTPNIIQATETLNIISWQEAKILAERGDASLIDVDDPTSLEYRPPESDITVLQIDFTESSFGYYMNQSTFYSQTGRKEIIPVYFFGGSDGRAAVVAEREVHQ